MIKLGIIILLLFSLTAYAYRPRLVFNQDLSLENAKVINDPEIAQTFYGELNGKENFYKIISRHNFDFYFNILAPDTPDSLTDFLVDVYGENKTISINGNQFDWDGYYEKLTGNNYLKGPSYEEVLPRGEYLIQISNSDNQGKYVLVVGKNDPFSLPEAINTILLMPKIKTFFEKPPITAYINQIGVVLFIILMIIIGIILLIVYFRQSMSRLDYR
jgi:hypothetical protein